LQGLGRVKVPIVNAGLALLIQTVLSAVLLLCTKIDLYGLAVTNTVYAGAMCILNQMSLRKAISYRQEWNRTFLRPLLAASVMGASARGLYQLLLMLFKSPRWALIPAVLFAVIVYFVLLLAFKTMTEEEMLTLPKGGTILRLARKLRLM
ncbi:MAG: polysaccharide biosynthesis C-terminal domain-containing protein, partial [Lachnospiraceae bacterium]|nr:polysaccharide biosynthesis C-terminal domain-containing protein [Lachnospiraceae bacterium]